MDDLLEKATRSAMYISQFIKEKPETAIILGSGLGKLANAVTERVEISYYDIPNFPVSKVQGHGNKLIYGKIYGKPVLVMQGRFHIYEGYSIQESAFPIKVFALLGISKLIVSNAAGAINRRYKTGDIMLIKDHIKMYSFSPLMGPNNPEFGERFPNMSEAYSERMRKIAKDVARKQGLILQEGIYAFMPGPQYETPAEIRMLEIIGADAVGMSTVPEVIAAVHSGIEVLGISCITNATSENNASHEAVLAAAEKVEEKFSNLVIEIIKDV